MLRRLLSKIFSSGSTLVDISLPSKELQRPWWEEDFRQKPDPEPSNRATAAGTVPVDSASVFEPGLQHEPDQVRKEFEEPWRKSSVKPIPTHREHKDSESISRVASFAFADTDIAADNVTSQVIDEGLPVKELTGMERTALIQLMGARYLAENETVSREQLSVVRSFAGFEWSPRQRDYWKAEYRNTDSWKLRKPKNATTKHEAGKTSVSNPTPLPPVSQRSKSVLKAMIPDPIKLVVMEELDSNAKVVLPNESLNPEQQRVFDFIENSTENLFITGRAGSGKSFLLRHLLRHSSKRALPVAFMGVAALNIGGRTIHSAFKLPLQLLLPNVGLEIVQRMSTDTKEMFREIVILVIDEISMVAADLFVAMDTILQAVNETDEPFGGV